MFFAEPEHADQSQKTDEVPQIVVACVPVQESILGFGANSAALRLLGGRGTDRRGDEKQPEHHASFHGILLRSYLRMTGNQQSATAPRSYIKERQHTKRGSIQSKRPDRRAIRAPCVTIARQPPWSVVAANVPMSQTAHFPKRAKFAAFSR